MKPNSKNQWIALAIDSLQNYVKGIQTISDMDTTKKKKVNEEWLYWLNVVRPWL
jgi:hypothetical protein